jgi:tetratricopeptide (TPR) repeat protein
MLSRIVAILAAAALMISPVFAQGDANAVDPISLSETEASGEGMTPEMLYEFLLAEIASQRDQGGVAAEAYAELARKLRDPRIAQRAVETALASRDSELAVKAANLWLELEPESMTARQTLIGLLLATGKINDATPHIKSLLNSQPAIVGRTFMQLGALMVRYPDKLSALKAITDLAADYQDVPEARFVTAQTARAAQQPQAALAESKAALALRPDWELAALLHGDVLLQGGPRKAIKFYREFLEKYPAARDVRTNLARQLASEKDFSGARKEFEVLLAAAPTMAEYHFALGILCVELKDYAAAEKHLTRTLELNFRDPDTVRTYLGQMNEDQKRLREAIGWYRQVQDGESYFASQLRAASLMAKQGDLKGGRAHLATIRTTNSEQKSLVVIANAQILREAKQYENALNALSEGLKSEPDSPELLYDRAMTAEKLNRLDVLETDLRKIITLKPDHAHAYNALGYTFAERNIRLPEALDLIEKAYELDSQDAAILDSMGWINYRLGNLDKGLDYLRRALAVRPDPEIAAHLAEVLLALGERGEAKTISEQALRDNPDNEALLAVAKKLEVR